MLPGFSSLPLLTCSKWKSEVSNGMFAAIYKILLAVGKSQG